MEIKIELEKLRGNKLFVATPCYGGMATGAYTKSVLDLQNTCIKYGIEVKFSFLFNESLITRARNMLTFEFLRSDYTHLLFIDSDINFNPKDVIAMMALDKDVIGGPYPKKSINWNNIKRAIIKDPEIDPKALENLVGEYVFNIVKGTDKFNVTEPLEVMEIGTGYMMIKRDVFSKMKEAYPKLYYKPDHLNLDMGDEKYIHAFFDTMIDYKDSPVGGGSDRYLSEDYSFCQMWRKIGGQIYLCPWMKTQHVGSYSFTGNLPAVANMTGKL